MNEEKKSAGTQQHQDKKDEVKKPKQAEPTKLSSGQQPGTTKK